MSEVAAQDGRARRRAFAGAAREEARQSRAATGLDARRALQFGLAGLWLLDGVLQYQIGCPPS